MVATANGLDVRLMDAAQALLAVGRGSPTGQPMSLPEFLRLRCQQLLAAYPTTLEEDEALLERLRGEEEAAAAAGSSSSSDAAAASQVAAAARDAQDGGMSSQGRQPRLAQLATAVRYRAGKKRVLHATLAAVQQP